MIVDTSALLAIVFDEPDADRYAAALTASHDASIPAPNWLEAVMVVSGRGVPGELDALGEALIRLRIEIIPFGAAQAHEAALAASRFGKESGHPARLNYGDCMAYGAAKPLGRALLFKGGDFSRGNIASALAA